jgi:hypothetical protein
MNRTDYIDLFTAALDTEERPQTFFALRVQHILTALVAAVARAGERNFLARSDRPVSASTLDLDGPKNVGFEKNGQPCRCEKDAWAVRLLKHRDEGEALVSDTEDSLRFDGLAIYNRIERGDRKAWLEGSDPRAVAVRNYFRILNHVAFVEEACKATAHYIRVEDRTPEIARPVQTTQTRTLTETIRVWDENGEEREEVVNTTTTAVRLIPDARMVEQANADELYEFIKHRGALVSSRSYDTELGYVVKLNHRASDEREQREAEVEGRLTARLKRLAAEGKPAHPWLDPRRGAGHGRGVNTIVRRRGEAHPVPAACHSTFWQVTQREKALGRVHSQKRRVAALVEALGMSVKDDRVRARIAQLGLDAAEAALEERALAAGVAA